MSADLLDGLFTRSYTSYCARCARARAPLIVEAVPVLPIVVAGTVAMFIGPSPVEYIRHIFTKDKVRPTRWSIVPLDDVAVCLLAPYYLRRPLPQRSIRVLIDDLDRVTSLARSRDINMLDCLSYLAMMSRPAGQIDHANRLAQEQRRMRELGEGNKQQHLAEELASAISWACDVD